MKQLGTVEVLKTRIYNLDPECHCPTSTSVVVGPGTYPVYSDGLTTLWVMSGAINQRDVQRMGDGMFAINQGGDSPSEIRVTFPSRSLGPDEWADLIASPLFRDGHAEQRMHLTLPETEA